MSTEKRREPGRRERRKTPERQTKQFAPDIVTTQPKSFEYRRLENTLYHTFLPGKGNDAG